MTEKIAIAAIQYGGKTYTGGRHINIIGEIFSEHGWYPRGRAEGFLTDTDRFVSRREAAEIAFAAGQTHTKLDFLYSEDIY